MTDNRHDWRTITIYIFKRKIWKPGILTQGNVNESHIKGEKGSQWKIVSVWDLVWNLYYIHVFCGIASK